jgi:hypothetical protein
MEQKREAKSWVDGILWGITLVGIGVVLLLGQQGFLPHGWWRDWWPGAFFLWGLAQVLTPRTAERLGSGITMMLLSVWFFMAQIGWHGLGFRNSWPLALVAVGVGEVARAASSRVLPDTKKEARRA